MLCIEAPCWAWEDCMGNTLAGVAMLGMKCLAFRIAWALSPNECCCPQVALIHRLVKKHGCSVQERSVNSWTPLHYAAAHNQVSCSFLLAMLCRL